MDAMLYDDDFAPDRKKGKHTKIDKHLLIRLTEIVQSNQ